MSSLQRVSRSASPFGLLPPTVPVEEEQMMPEQETSGSPAIAEHVESAVVAIDVSASPTYPVDNLPEDNNVASTGGMPLGADTVNIDGDSNCGEQSSSPSNLVTPHLADPSAADTDKADCVTSAVNDLLEEGIVAVLDAEPQQLVAVSVGKAVEHDSTENPTVPEPSLEPSVLPPQEEPSPIVSEADPVNSSPSHIAVLPHPQPSDGEDQIIPDRNAMANQKAHTSQEPADGESAMMEPEDDVDPISIKAVEGTTTMASEPEAENTGSLEDSLQIAPVSVEISMECPTPPMSPIMVKEDAVPLRHSPGTLSKGVPCLENDTTDTPPQEANLRTDTPVGEPAPNTEANAALTTSTVVDAEATETMGECPSFDVP